MIIKVIIRRLCELLLICAIISAIITFFFVAGILYTDTYLSIALLIGLFLFAFINLRMLRQCYFDLHNNKNYYFSNILSYVIFALVSFGVCKLCSGIIFTWLFAVTKFLKYTNAGISTITSMLFFHIIGILSVLLAPIGMKWVVEDIEE